MLRALLVPLSAGCDSPTLPREPRESRKPVVTAVSPRLERPEGSVRRSVSQSGAIGQSVSQWLGAQAAIV